MEQNNALAREFNAASLLRFALPNIAMMMLLSMYTIVDGMFISRFAGTTALSAERQPVFPASVSAPVVSAGASVVEGSVAVSVSAPVPVSVPGSAVRSSVSPDAL